MRSLGYLAHAIKYISSDSLLTADIVEKLARRRFALLVASTMKRRDLDLSTLIA